VNSAPIPEACGFGFFSKNPNTVAASSDRDKVPRFEVQLGDA
jgi:hypothetical protein